MTSIKPPSGSVTTLPHTSGLDAGPSSSVDASESLQQTADVEGTADLRSVSQGHAAGATTDADQIGAASSTAGAGEVQQVNLVDLARAVEAGQLTMSQAVERLVEGTVGSLPRQLTDLERAELSELLRSAASSDPALSALQDEPA